MWSTLFPHSCGCCLHIITVVTYEVPIDTGHPQVVPIVPDMVPIDRGHLYIVCIVPDVVPIDKSHPYVMAAGSTCGPVMLALGSLNWSNTTAGSSIASQCLDNMTSLWVGSTCLTRRLRLLSPVLLIANVLL